MSTDGPDVSQSQPQPFQHAAAPQPFEVAVARKLESRSTSLLDTFLRLDVDGDGCVTRADFKTALHNMLGLDLTTEHIDAIFARFPACGDPARSEVDGNQYAATVATMEHGIRYSEFVEWMHDTASSLLPASTAYGALAGLASQTTSKRYDRMHGAASLPRLVPVTPPPGAITRELRLALRRLLRQRTHVDHGGMKTRDLFLAIDSDRSGRITTSQFRAWASGLGLELTSDQVITLLGEHHCDEGINLHEFAEALDELDDTKSTRAPWENPPDEEARKRRLEARAAAEEARRKLGEAVYMCVDDGRTDQEMVKAVAEAIFKKRTTLLEAFNRYDPDCTGRLDAKGLRMALKEAGMDVSGKRADNVVKHFDRDGDGKLSKSEFVRMVGSSSTEDDTQITEKEAYSKDSKIEEMIASEGMESVTEGRCAAGASSIEKKRAALAASLTGHEDEERHREVTKRLDPEDVELISEFREALEEEKMIARNVFQSFDKTNRREITADELREGLEKLGLNVSQAQMSHIMRRFDKDGTGMLKYGDFLKLVSLPLDADMKV